MIQVLLVTGGGHNPGGTWTRLDSTEILETPGGSWRTLTTARLPSPRDGLRAGTANNIVFVFGKNCLNILFYISSFIIRRIWRIIWAQHHPLLQQDRGILAASWTNDCGEMGSRSGGYQRCLPALSLMMKTTWTGILNISPRNNVVVMLSPLYRL